jgi:hypothetical protein
MCHEQLTRFAVVLLASGWAFGAEPKPVPQVQALPQPYQQVSFQREGVEIARYHYGPGTQRPFVFPVIGPSGRSLTRMGHPRDPESHSHHNSVWISHQLVNGLNFWEDGRGGKIRHQRILRLEDGEQRAFVEAESVWEGKADQPMLQERRRIGVEVLEDGEWLLLLDLELSARHGPVELGQTAFGFIGVRMAKTIGVRDGGGTIRNSEGAVDEAQCFRKPARWVDYSGPIAPALIEGITLMDHPANVNHPVPFHVRNDGWMGAAATFAGAQILTGESPLRLKYALYVHRGGGDGEKIEGVWKRFAGSEFQPFPEKK